ncbi:MAG: 2OG-Fe(II) oxygenase [Gammaproteobacteria bacterium]|nr:2OG-Fe(II) oxygenase [Gammaproteobacteria bacterium]
MKFIREFSISDDLCDNLLALREECAAKGLVVRGQFDSGDGHELNASVKDSFDLGLINVPEDLQVKYKIPEFYQALYNCIQDYFKLFESMKNLGAIELGESPIIIHYEPGGGYKYSHCERTGAQTVTRMLTWMVYLNTVSDNGGTCFDYQELTVSAVKGKCVIWPSDFTHTHHGVVSETQEKNIITGWVNFSMA